MADAPACTQPGCSGTISDGYCDVCGMPPASGSPDLLAPAAMPPAAAPSAREGAKCGQPGCAGTITDGYCDVCGTPAGPSSVAIAEAQAAAEVASAAGTVGAESPVGGGGSAVSRVSSRLEATAIGSARVGHGTVSTRRISGLSRRMRAARIGAGVTTVPPVAEIDAAQAVLRNPVVPEDKRNCPSCGEPVGRGRDGQPGRAAGFCAKCRAPFDFSPKLKPGDLVAGQYEVAGCLAHGGLGWIYLARDRNVSQRWVVLKGLLNSGDPDALAAALAEQRFLAQVSHPNIVEIYNFVSHDSAGYIVMEYVGGTSLKSLLKQRMQASSGVYDPLPVDQALAYLIEILPAFQYLHDLGLVYCDFKPDNIIQIGDEVRLIDLGGVRKIDDDDSAIFGTVGYQAPEVAEHGCTVASDIYTIGRTLVVLTMEFRGYQSTYVKSLPPPEQVPVFSKYDSFYRLLLKACAPSPDDRFISADDLRVQLLGVLREVVATDQGRGAASSSATSVLFEPPPVGDANTTWRDLPALRHDTSDAGSGWLQTVAGLPAAERLHALMAAPVTTTETALAKATAALDTGNFALVDTTVQELLAEDPWEWRAVWLSGLAALAQGNPVAAQSAFNAVYGQVPGELAPKLALAVACELSGEGAIAETLYAICARTDVAFIPSAAFGLARLRSAREDLDGVLAALTLVPPNSSAHSLARQKWAEALALKPRGIADLDLSLSTAATAGFPARRRAEMAVDVYRRGLAAAEVKAEPDLRLGSYAATVPGMRSGLESALRDLAATSADPLERLHLIDEANTVRPWSLV